MTYGLDHRSGHHVDLLGDRYRLLATGDQTAGSIAVVEVTVRPGGGVPPHIGIVSSATVDQIDQVTEFLKSSAELKPFPITVLNAPN